MNLSLKTKQIIITTLTIVAIFLGVITAAIYTVRFDFTQDNTYTISKVSKETLRGLEDKVRLSFYISDKVIQQRPFAQTTIDLLEEIAASARKNVELNVVHLNSKNTPEYRQEMQGLQEWQIQMSDGKSSASVDIVFSGLFISYKGKKEIIPVIQEYNYQQLEYEVISKIRKMAYDYQLKIGIINGSSRPTTAAQQQMDLFQMGYNGLFEQSGQIYQDFSFENIELGTKIDNSYTAVFVVGADAITEEQVLIFDQYMMRGGALLFAAEQGQLAIDPQNQQMPITLTDLSNSPLMNFFKHYGVEYETGKLMDTNAKQTLAQGQGNLTIVPVVFQPKIISANKDYPFHNNFAGINLNWPEALKIAPRTEENSEIVINTLLSSSKASALSPNSDPRAMWEPAAGLQVYNMVPKEMHKSYPVSVHVSGVLPSYFNEKELPSADGEDALYDEIVKSTDVGQFMVIADTEFLSDYLLSEGQQVLVQNLLYIRNVVEYLGGDKELLKVRTKIPGVRELNVDPETKDSISLVAILMNVILVPLSILVFAITWLVIRKKRTK